MQSDIRIKRANKAIYRYTLFLDEVSILLAFFSALLIRFRAVIQLPREYVTLYISMILTSLLIEIIVFLLYDMKRPNVVLMDPVDNLVTICKNRIILAFVTILYFFLAQKSVLASRIVMGLFLLLSVFYGYLIRMIFRQKHIVSYGIPGQVKVYEINPASQEMSEYHKATDAMAKELSVAPIITKIQNGDYDCALIKEDDKTDFEPLLRALEKSGIRTYLSLSSMGRQVDSHLPVTMGRHMVIPAYVRTERCDVFGVHYCVSKSSEAVGHVLDHLQELKGKYVCFSNVHTSVMARESGEYRQVLNEAALTFPDGTPIAKRQFRLGYSDAERVAGPDFMEGMFRETMDGKVSHYFYGSTQNTLDKLKENLETRYPGINIKGMYSPPFRPMTPEEDAKDIKRINDSGADIIWIGLGAPKQEKWMNAHKDKVNGVMMGVGAGFDFHAGTIRRAPVYLQKVGLEWLYRLFTDPGRLFRRYVVTNCKFVWYMIGETTTNSK